MESDHSYFLKRAEQERSAAAAARGKAREAHEQMAELHTRLAEFTKGPERIAGRRERTRSEPSPVD